MLVQYTYKVKYTEDSPFVNTLIRFLIFCETTNLAY